METTPAAAGRAPFFEPEPVPEKKRAHSTGVRDSDGSDAEEEGSTESVPSDDDEDVPMSDDSTGSISDEYDSETEWDEAKLEEANKRKYWDA